MSKNVIAVVRKLEEGPHVMCTFNNYKDADEWIDSRYRTEDYYVVPCEMQIVTDSPVPVKGVQFMTVLYDNHLGKGTLAIRCTIAEMVQTSLPWMKACVKTVHVPIVYEFEEKNV
jgi:hypothetical protein